MADETATLNSDKHKREFRRFIDDEEGNSDYKKKIQRMLAQGGGRLTVDLNDMRAYDEQQKSLDPTHESITQGLLMEPAERLPAYEAVLKTPVENEDSTYSKEKHAEREYHIGVEGSFGANHVSPRALRSPLLANLVCVEGIVTKAAPVRPKVVKSVHYCPATQQSIQREYRDATSFRGMPTGSTYPTKDDNGNLLETEFGLSKYSDTQKLVIQEMPERSPPGQLPCSIPVTVSDDLCDLCKPGDRVQIVGVYRALPNRQGGTTSGQFKTLIIGNGVKVLSKEMAQPVMNEVDIENIKKLSKQDDVFDILSASIAPSIYGHTELKQALLLLLLGGCEKNLKNGTHIRGDINMLLIGDPSTAKSQMLRAAMNVAPLAISTTGRGSSGVGLTAAVTADSDSGERRLEAGAMVLADRGMVCIDEFDKMSDPDRVAIHEVMEQQTVTISKAGIHASLNARCSVLAAANPIYGTYDRSLSPIRNIGLPDSLLSRFDLLFVVLDQKDEEVDRAVSDHVLRLHRYCPRGQEGLPMVFRDKYELEGVGGDSEEEDPQENNMYQRHDRLLNRFQTGEILTTKFLKKYIHYAKSRFDPVVTKNAHDQIVDFYTELRGQHSGDQNTLPVTVRTLETIIRLSSAHAKCRLSNEVEEVDVLHACALMRAAIFSETYSTTKDNLNRDRQPAEEAEGEESDDGPDSDGDEPVSYTHLTLPTKRIV
eukprot:TRINITY_DN6477_c0_g1_i2.p1 TRINITY_DN6477_c0_g1~~TRINITY_DN6477_c0_g1_i2.p1  ORF type:complete len:710 (-),score=202.92 TRINITY_DN6477_c0_g1_i2:112-2241(-)